jgi:hypothetical protein
MESFVHPIAGHLETENEMTYETTQVPFCPNSNDNDCEFEQRFDTKEVSVEVIKALAARFPEPSQEKMIEAMVAAAEKVYVGESCQYCGAFRVQPLDQDKS